jgi:prolyl-tRNA synthetase
MKLSNGFWQTYKETPSEAEVPSHQLMLRAGLIQKAGSGLYNYLPIGLKVIQKVENIVREELNKGDCYELSLTVITPGEFWQQTGRWDSMGPTMLKAKDRGGRDLCVSPTNEEAIVEVFKKTIKSYKQLPVTLYQINTKFRDEIRPRFGIMRGREFNMKDAYSFHIDDACLDKGYNKLFKIYENIFNRLGLNFIAVEADAGAMADGKSKTHEFQVLAQSGEDKVIRCLKTNYSANIEKAQTFRKNLHFKYSSEYPLDVATPAQKTIKEVCGYLKILECQCLKSLMIGSIKGKNLENILVILLGDDELNEIKLKNYLGSDHLRQLSENEIEELGLINGFIGPTATKVNPKSKIRLIFDLQVDLNASYVIGANKKDYHTVNFIPIRDIGKDFLEQGDFRLSRAGDFHKIILEDGKEIEGEVDEICGIEVGHIFQLGEKYTRALNASVLDKNGKEVFPTMGCYGIGTTRVVAAAIEQNHDENGIIWPLSISPFQIHFCSITKSEEMDQIASEIYKELLLNQFEVLFDDRKNVGAGFKFKDADLLGLPIRLVFGERDYLRDEKLEIRIRKDSKIIKVGRAELIQELKRFFKGEKI